MLKTILLLISGLFFRHTVNCQDPNIVMTTELTINSTFHFSLAAYTDNTVIQVDFGDGILVNQTIGQLSTEIKGKLGDSQIVKIYGTGIISLICDNCKLTALDVTNNGRLLELYCQKNQLTTLDVTKNSALKNLDCYNNELTTLNVTRNALLTRLFCYSNQLKTIILSKNTALKYLYCNKNQFETLDLTQNTALTWLNCSNNLIKTLDLTRNKALTWLDCSENQLAKLDVTNNTTLTTFYCYSNQLTELDVTKNASLTDFYCFSNQLKKLDVTQNIALANLSCSSNQLIDIDVTQNNALTGLVCFSNYFTALDISKNNALTLLICYSNQFNFASLPLKKASWDTYSYAPQKQFPIAKNSIIGTEVDLSSLYSRENILTTYTWKTQSGATLFNGKDYTISDGKTIFIKSQKDSVYCEMTNATFPDFAGENVLKTTYTKISLATAIKNKEKQKIELYTKYKSLYINTPYSAQLSIFKTNGSLVLSKPITNGVNKIQWLNTGVYLVKISGNNEMFSRKVIVE